MPADVDVPGVNEPLYSKVLADDGSVAAVVAETGDFKHLVVAWARPHGRGEAAKILGGGRWSNLADEDEALEAMTDWPGQDPSDALLSLKRRLDRAQHWDT